MPLKILEQYQELWKAIIRPPRDVYELKDLGPIVFSIEDQTFYRTDICLKNSRGQNLVCSHYEPIAPERVAEQLPCVVYLHGNCSSQLEATCTLSVLLPLNITVFCFDFAGSGLSDGEYLSLGFFEKDDLAAVVRHLRESNRTSCIGLWGRSMGAATALLHADRDPSIAGIVVDSAFADLKHLVEEIADAHVNFKVPRWMLGLALELVRSSIRQHAGFDLYELVPIKHVTQSFSPAMFAAATQDNFIHPHHTKELHAAYAGDKTIVMVEGDHNSARSKLFMDSVALFFYNVLQCEQLPRANTTAFNMSSLPAAQPGADSSSGTRWQGPSLSMPSASSGKPNTMPYPLLFPPSLAAIHVSALPSMLAFAAKAYDEEADLLDEELVPSPLEPAAHETSLPLPSPSSSPCTLRPRTGHELPRAPDKALQDGEDERWPSGEIQL